MSKPRTQAGRALLARGSNNWTGSDWLERFSDGITVIEAEAGKLDDAWDDLDGELLLEWSVTIRIEDREGLIYLVDVTESGTDWKISASGPTLAATFRTLATELAGRRTGESRR